MVCVGVITYIGLRIAGTPLALTLAVMAAGLEIIPSIGPVLWLVPAALVALTDNTTQVAYVVGIYSVTHIAESYILIPLVQRRTVWLPPVLSILAVVLLGLIAGSLGWLVAAPLALVVMLLVKMLYIQDWLGDRTVDVPGEA
jgi:predicted PurR-regulated permease PerM